MGCMLGLPEALLLFESPPVTLLRHSLLCRFCYVRCTTRVETVTMLSGESCNGREGCYLFRHHRRDTFARADRIEDRLHALIHEPLFWHG